MLVGAKRAFSAGDLSHEIIKAVPKVHSVLGPGLLESAYEACLLYELEKANFKVACQVPLL
jgi:GxxExxY protein